MPFYLFIWDGENEKHLEEHGVSPEEFSEVVCDPHRVEKSRSSGRPIAFGYTSTGRYLACVYEMIDETSIYPVTAYEPEE
ncbi:MAG: BrnT family toxin [Pirellulaceae bacterium]|nr:BrnT family toxin [Pirellulaceae bacterium]